MADSPRDGEPWETRGAWRFCRQATTRRADQGGSETARGRGGRGGRRAEGGGCLRRITEGGGQEPGPGLGGDG